MNHNTDPDHVSSDQGKQSEINLFTQIKSKSIPFSKSSRQLDRIETIDETSILPLSPTDLKLNQHRRSFSTKNFTLKRISTEEPADETIQFTRKNSEVSVRSTGRPFSKFHSRAASIDKRIQSNMHFFTASSPGQSRGASLADFCHSNHLHSEVQAIKNRSEELVGEVLTAIKAHQIRIEDLMRETGVQPEENNYNALDEKVAEVIENLVGETAGLGTIEWENKFESLKKELVKFSSRNDQITRSLKENQSNLQKEYDEHFDIAKILSSNNNPQLIVKELTALLEAKKKIIQQTEAERTRSERETKDARVLLKRKEEEIALWSGKAERFVRQIKDKDHQIKETTSKLSSLKRKNDSKTRENATIVQSHQRSKEELVAKNSSEISAIDTQLSELVNKTKSIDGVYGRLAAQEREMQRLNLELQASAEEIRRLTEENEKEQAATEETVRELQKKHAAVVRDLNLDHQAKMRSKNKEVQLHQSKVDQLQKESDVRQSTIHKLTSETELLKKKVQEQGSVMSIKEEKYRVEISLLNKKMSDMAEILSRRAEGKPKQSNPTTTTTCENANLN